MNKSVLSRLFIVWGLVAAAAVHAAPLEFNIEAQPLASALATYAEQADLQVLFPQDSVRGLQSKAVRGKMEKDRALQLLLAETGLEASFAPNGTVLVKAIAQSQAEAIGVVRTSPELRMAQNETGKALPPEGKEAAAPNGREGNEEGAQLEEVVVTGTHIRGATDNKTVSTTVLDRTYIDATGISTVTGLVESLPQNFALIGQSGVVIPGVTSNFIQGASINLRGIGEGTTLTLLNGRRMAPGFFGSAVDISALPLSAIERVDILPDGASAIYGSDAVGGVVNFVLRRNFEGAETRLRSGWAEGGINEYRASQALGHGWGSGNALVSLEYYKRDLLPTSERDFVPSTSLVGSLLPQDRNLSALVSGRQQISEAVSVFADALYTDRDSHNEGGSILQALRRDLDNSQFSGTLGLDWSLKSDWQIETFASYARNKLDSLDARTTFTIPSWQRFEIETAGLKGDGPLFVLPGGDVRVAVGAEWRSETFEFSNLADPTDIRNLDQIVRSAFGEVYIPIVGADNASAGIHRLQLSLAGRFDDYSSFGSSFDPKAGVMWEPIEGLELRASYGTSFVAPNLRLHTFADNQTAALPDFDSGAYVMQITGTDVNTLKAQESENISLGFQATPSSFPGLTFGMNYYNIKYKDRIALPGDVSVMLGNSAIFGALVISDPSVAQVNEAIAIGNLGQPALFLDENFEEIAPENFDPSTVDVLVDQRTRNLNTVKTSGLDASIQYGFKLAGGDAQVGLTGTRVLEKEFRVTSSSAPLDEVDTIYNPPDWRARGSFSWQSRGWTTNLFVNYTDSYTDTRTAPAAEIASYTTVDTRVAYSFSERFAQGFLSGVSIAASAQNLFDRDPPRVAVLIPVFETGFDPTNASPMGRLLAIELTKTW